MDGMLEYGRAWVSEFLVQATGAAARALEGIEPYSEDFGLMLALIFALVCLLSARRAGKRAARLETEISKLGAGLLALERLHFRSERQMVLLDDDLKSLKTKQQKSSLRESKVDYRLAAAMIRAGAGEKQIVDCGLSHGEAHLIDALHGRKGEEPGSATTPKSTPDLAA